jgi:UTP--glucose-1-phosphate uridylyltransferase
MEVTDRTEIDRKGGTLIVRDGSLDLLEIAQVSPDEKEQFMDIDRFRIFNTNNLWVNLEALATTLEDDSLNLPIIRNRKTIAGVPVIQFETAMGAAVGSFPRAKGLRVSRDRFFPTKKVEDLFVLQSDACILNAAYRLRRNPNRPVELPLRPYIEFSSDFLSSPTHMSDRFANPASVSLVDAESLKVSGSVFFEQNVSIQGAVEIQGPKTGTYHIAPGTDLKSGVYP